jgi:hypothetical protein
MDPREVLLQRTKYFCSILGRQNGTQKPTDIRKAGLNLN